MILHWLKQRRASAAKVASDADALIRQFGSRAYDEARRRAREALTRKPYDSHWSRVRREIGRRMGRVYLDTATRYLDQ